MFKNIYSSVLYLSVILWCVSCKSFTEIDPPKSAIDTEHVFVDDASANSAILGIYATLNNVGFGYGNVTIITGMSSDELIMLDPDANSTQIMSNNLLAANTKIAGLWDDAYKVIGQANGCIEGLEEAGVGVSDAKKGQLMGEAKFLRAYCYFYLVNLYGDVPLILTTDWTTTKNIKRSTVNEVYAKILDDLDQAYQNLPDAYDSGTKARATKWAAAGLLSRANLYLKQWDQAEKYASVVIDESGLFEGVLPDLNGVFLTGSSEAIWQMPPVSYWKNTYEGSLFVNYGNPQYVIRDGLKNSFEDNDQRVTDWLTEVTSGEGDTYYAPYKYKADTYSGDAVEEYVMMRMAEQFLIRAEARANQDNLDGAIEDLNVIRTRAGLEELAINASKDNVRLMVEHERETEFFAEWGTRWLDLKRLSAHEGSGSLADELLGTLDTKYWKSSDALYPVPEKEIKSNPALGPNNEGY
ncbi:SusD family protein [bacterium A37T11]|nr:SusD family protein [bacterium A37T11]